MYQVKRTPYVRRLVAKSKKNGELQRLKREYERIQEFNEHAVENRLRQVRLKRLNDKINKIKESNTQRKRREPAKTPQDERLEQFKKARELGKAYSKMNAIQERDLEQRLEGGTIKTQSATVKEKLEKIERTNKRVDYGNEISRYNMLKNMLSSKSKVERKTRQQIELAEAEEEKKQKLRHRINYGNLTSNINMLKVIGKKKRQLDKGQENRESDTMEKSKLMENTSYQPTSEKQSEINKMEMLQKFLHHDLFQRDTLSPGYRENYHKSSSSPKYKRLEGFSLNTTEQDIQSTLVSTFRSEIIANVSGEDSYTTATEYTENLDEGTLCAAEDLPPPPPEMLGDLSTRKHVNYLNAKEEPHQDSEGNIDLRAYFEDYSKKFRTGP